MLRMGVGGACDAELCKGLTSELFKDPAGRETDTSYVAAGVGVRPKFPAALHGDRNPVKMHGMAFPAVSVG
jgi:hypothetical protein